MYPPSLQKLIDIFSKFPTIGPRTAGRFVFYLLKLSNTEIENLLSAVSNLKKEVKICKLCFYPFQSKEEICGICQNQKRDKTLLCVVEKENDLATIEKTKRYKGLYFVLGGTVSKLRKEDINKLRVKELQERVKTRLEIKEIILAVNPTAEGEATTLYLERVLKPLNIKITRLGRGLPVGAELEYADEETLSSALESRK